MSFLQRQLCEIGGRAQRPTSQRKRLRPFAVMLCGDSKMISSSAFAASRTATPLARSCQPRTRVSTSTMSHDEEDSEAAFKHTTPFDKYAGNSRPAPPATGGGLIGPSMAIFTLSLRNVQSHT